MGFNSVFKGLNLGETTCWIPQDMSRPAPLLSYHKTKSNKERKRCSSKWVVYGIKITKGKGVHREVLQTSRKCEDHLEGIMKVWVYWKISWFNFIYNYCIRSILAWRDVSRRYELFSRKLLSLSLFLSLLSLDTIKLTLQPRTICCQNMIYTSYEFGVDFLHINKIQYHDASGKLR